MWLHVPNLPASPCAQGLEGLTLLSELSLDVELWVTSSGKPTLRPCSWRGWRTRPWIRLLYGTISRPSTASHGADEWISSLPVTHASPSALPVKGSQRKTPDTSGPRSPASSRKLVQGLLFSKTSKGTSAEDSGKSSKSFMAWGSMRSGEFIQRPKPELHTAATEFSSWPTVKNWATPIAGDAKSSRALGYSTESGRHSGTTLTDAIKQWPPPSATRSVKNWATPTARDHKDGTDPSSKAPTNSLLGRQDQAATGQMSHPNSGLRLLWTTPQAHDSQGLGDPKRVRRYGTKHGGANLVDDAAASMGEWRTPNACSGNSLRGSGADAEERQAQGHQVNLQDQAFTAAGKDRGTRLNPLFVEWLMGLPIGWTDFEPLGTPSAPSRPNSP